MKHKLHEVGAEIVTLYTCVSGIFRALLTCIDPKTKCEIIVMKGLINTDTKSLLLITKCFLLSSASSWQRKGYRKHPPPPSSQEISYIVVSSIINLEWYSQNLFFFISVRHIKSKLEQAISLIYL